MPDCAKVRYDTRRHAKQVARKLQYGPLTAYQCRDCGFWHLTSQSTKRKTFFRSIERRNA